MKDKNQEQVRINIDKMAWIGIYNAHVEHQHIHMEEKRTSGEPAGEEPDVEPAGEVIPPENFVFEKFHEGKPLDFLTIRKHIETYLVNDIKRKYEWYAAYRILDDLMLLDDLKLTSFAKQMNNWFPDAKVPCEDDSLGDYVTGHTGMRFSKWNETVFKNEMKNNQSLTGFRRLSNICYNLQEAFKHIPTLTPNQP